MREASRGASVGTKGATTANCLPRSAGEGNKERDLWAEPPSPRVGVGATDQTVSVGALWEFRLVGGMAQPSSYLRVTTRGWCPCWEW